MLKLSEIRYIGAYIGANGPCASCLKPLVVSKSPQALSPPFEFAHLHILENKAVFADLYN